ncbi:hypothetical protein MFRU_007g02450 [Monilinia fructicola]|uniref:Uncharacterized protein n=1 Tax=Monilinia fructicola TaxID=38448 RepID=A0A5M9JD02_MONFR|nr:hypothetical protein EYC84_010214 [Monilinia fructicola]KAG4032338.1 hypothetical protein MFRU_007g02450 [Monilinia fructicola]
MSLIRRRQSGSENSEAPPAKKRLTISLSFKPMSLEEACDIGSRYNGAVFAKHTVQESWKARMVILSALSAKYKQLDEVIAAQDLVIDRAKAAIAALRRVYDNVSNGPQRPRGQLPVRASVMLFEIFCAVNAINQNEADAQKNLAKTAEMTRVVANASKMMLADCEKKYLLPFFVTPTASSGCGVELGHCTGLAATRRTTRTWAARLSMEEMWTSGAIEFWWDAETADVNELMGLSIDSLFHKFDMHEV